MMCKRMVSLALGVLLAASTSAAFAQADAPPPPDQGQPGPGGPRHMDPDRQLQHMTQELDLTPDQQSQIKPILVDRQQKMEALFQDQSLAQQDRRAKMRSIRQDSRSKIEAVLNDQQKQKFETMEQNMGRRGRGGPPPDGAAPPQM
jgi:periplasmic protein CpxP/Spy